MRVLVLLLLVTPVAAQDFDATPEDPYAVHAPVQLLLDQFPTVLDLAIDESFIDGTPHDAEALVARMRAYFAGLEGQPPWPAKSDAARSDARSSYERVGALLDAAASIPGAIGSLSRIDAACIAGSEASELEVAGWWRTALGDVRALDDLDATLTALAAGIEAPLDATPVEAAGQHLRNWLSVQAGGVQFCLEEIAVQQGYALDAVALPEALIGYAVDPYIRFSAYPSEAYPGASVFLTGRLVGPVGEVHIAAAQLGWDVRVQPDPRGLFSQTLVVPADAVLADHLVWADGAGLSSNLTLAVRPAPVTMSVASPGPVLPGDAFTLNVSLYSPLPFRVPPTVTVDGTPLPLGVRWSDVAGAPGTMHFVVEYAGDGRHAAARQDVAVEVVAPVVEVGPGNPVWELLEKQVWYDPVWQISHRVFDVQRPRVAAGALLAIAAAITTFVLLELGISSRRREDEAFEEEMAVPDRVRWPTSFIHAYALLAALLVRRRVLPPGATPRDVSRHLHAAGLVPGRAVREFEFARYGRRIMPIELSRKRSRWTQALWHRMGGR